MKTKGRDGRTEVERAADKGHGDSDESCSRMLCVKLSASLPFVSLFWQQKIANEHPALA